MSESRADTRRYARFEMMEYAMVYFDGLPEPLRAVVVDIGLGGLQIRTRGQLPAGETCMIHVGAEQGKSFRLKCEVRHSSPVEDSGIFATGLRFMPAGHEDRVAVAEYVHSVFLRQGDFAAEPAALDI